MDAYINWNNFQYRGLPWDPKIPLSPKNLQKEFLD